MVFVAHPFTGEGVSLDGAVDGGCRKSLRPEGLSYRDVGGGLRRTDRCGRGCKCKNGGEPPHSKCRRADIAAVNKTEKRERRKRSRMALVAVA